MQILNAENRDWKELFLENKIPIIISTLLVVAGATTAAVSDSIADSDKIVSGVNFEGMPLAGMNDTAAKNFCRPFNNFSTVINPLNIAGNKFKIAAKFGFYFFKLRQMSADQHAIIIFGKKNFRSCKSNS